MDREIFVRIQNSYSELLNKMEDPLAWAKLEEALAPLQHLSKGGSQDYECVRRNLQPFLGSSVAQILVELCDTPKTLLTCSCVETAEHILTLFADVVHASQSASSAAVLSLERCKSPIPKCR